MSIDFERKEFINQYPPFALMAPKGVSGLFDKRPAHLYIHLPFCKHKCGYCFFKSFERRDRAYVDKYLTAMKAEIDIYSAMPEVRSRVFKSLYFGGGTPTLLDCDHLGDIVRYVQSKFPFDPDYELCLEANPDDESLTEEKFKLLKELGARRISFGVQSFNDEILRLNDRTNTTDVFLRKYAEARAHNFGIINIDIMSGLYGESPWNWDRTIDRLLDLRPDNVAFYKLEVYYNTKLFKNMRRNQEEVPLMGNADEIALIAKAFDRLQDEGGYLVSNCFILISSSEKEHLHRKGVWQGEEMLGLGLSAHSCFNGHLYQNALSVNDYRNSLAAGELPIRRAHRCSREDDISTAVVYGLKSLRIGRADFASKFGVDVMSIYGEKIRELVDMGCLEVNEDEVRVPRKYFIFSDDIARQFFLPKYHNMMLAHHLRNGSGGAP